MTDHSDKVPMRVQRKRTKGWRMPENTVCVTRPSRWGNPFKVGRSIDLSLSLRLFNNAVNGFWSPSILADVPFPLFDNIYAAHCQWKLGFVGPHPLDAARAELRGHNLACYCKLCDEHKDGRALNVKCEKCAKCHIDVLGEILYGKAT